MPKTKPKPARTSTNGRTRSKPAAKATARAARKRAANGGTHTESEDHPWTIRIEDHPRRTDSREYIASRKSTNAMAKKEKNWFFGHEPYEDHHGGGLWVKDEDGWFVVRNLAGIEWSAQFCADPAKVDALRMNAKRIYARFPESVDELGIRELLDTPITDAAGVAQWTDSICNASMALPKALHTGVLPHAGGIHHYPAPIAEIALFKYDDFQLWQTDAAGKAIALVPVAPRGSNNGKTVVAYAEPGSAIDKAKAAADQKHRALELPEDDQLSATAFNEQYAKLAQGGIDAADPLVAAAPSAREG
jgi:hypothetical protein